MPSKIYKKKMKKKTVNKKTESFPDIAFINEFNNILESAFDLDV